MPKNTNSGNKSSFCQVHLSQYSIQFCSVHPGHWGSTGNVPWQFCGRIIACGKSSRRIVCYITSTVPLPKAYISLSALNMRRANRRKIRQSGLVCCCGWKEWLNENINTNLEYIGNLIVNCYQSATTAYYIWFLYQTRILCAE